MYTGQGGRARVPPPPCTPPSSLYHPLYTHRHLPSPTVAAGAGVLWAGSLSREEEGLSGQGSPSPRGREVSLGRVVLSPREQEVSLGRVAVFPRNREYSEQGSGLP